MENELIKIVQLSPSAWPVYKKLRLEALQNDPQTFGPSYQETLAKPDSYWQGRLETAEQRQD